MKREMLLSSKSLVSSRPSRRLLAAKSALGKPVFHFRQSLFKARTSQRKTTETNLLDARSFEPKHAENEPDAKVILPERGGVKEGSFCRYKNYGKKGIKR